MLNSVEASRLLGVNVSTIKRWTDEGKLECQKTAGGHRKFLMTHLARFLKSQQGRHARLNLFPVENQEDLDIAHDIGKQNWDALVQRTLRFALASSRTGVQRIFNGLYLSDNSLYQIYDSLVTPVLYRLGEMWIRKELSVVEEHLATQNVRDAIVRLQGIVRIPSRRRETVLLMNLADELHDIALKMVDHVLEERGFRVLNSGQLSPARDAAPIFDKFHPRRLYLSSTFVQDAQKSQLEIDLLYDLCSRYNTQIFVGGQGFDYLDTSHPQVVKRLSTFQEVADI
jgi:excisionase family DNA binding protein